MKLLLDTNLLLHAIGGTSRLPDDLRQSLADPQHNILYSAASIWEIAIKAALGRADFLADAGQIDAAARTQGFQSLAVETRHAIHVQSLPDIHRDPFDRLLLAQALVDQAWLLTTDRTLQRYGGPVRTISLRPLPS